MKAARVRAACVAALDAAVAGAALGTLEAAWVGAHAARRGAAALAALWGLSAAAYALAAAGVCLPLALAASKRTGPASPAATRALGAGVAVGCALGFRLLTQFVLNTTPALAWFLPGCLAMAAAGGWLWTRAASTLPVLAMRSSWACLLALLLIAGAGRVWSLSAPATTVNAAEDAPNIVLLSIDTLRRDRIGVYGSERARTPNLDRLAERSVVFDEAVAPVAFTGPSHTTMLTGLYPRRHGAIENGTGMRGGVSAVTDLLAAAGYRTGAFVSTVVLDGRATGLAEHFQRYDDDSSPLAIPDLALKTGLGRLIAEVLRVAGRLVIDVRRQGPATSRAALTWMSADRDRPFFAFVHYYDVHAPYDPPPPYDTMYDDDRRFSADNRVVFHRLDDPEVRRILADPARVEHQRAMYDAGVSYGDTVAGDFLRELDRAGSARETVVVFVADHGESLGEHDFYFTHGEYLYDTCIRVPLMLRLPGGRYAGRRVRAQVRLTDIAPTLLELAGLPPQADSDGASLLALIEAGESAPERVAFGSVWQGDALEHRSRHYVRTRRYKMIWNFDFRGLTGAGPVSEELYDLHSDPAETVDLSATLTQPAAHLRSLLERWSRASVHRGRGPDSETIEKLEALGYL